MLNGWERNLHTTHQERVAVSEAILLLRSYMKGIKFIVWTNHHTLKWIGSITYTTGKPARWRSLLMKYDFDTVRMACVKKETAETSLQLPTEGTDDSNINDDTSIMNFTARTQKVLSEVTNNTTKRNHTGTNESQSSALDEFITARDRDAYCDNIQTTVGIPGFTSI